MCLDVNLSASSRFSRRRRRRCGGASCVSSECSRMLPPLQGKDTLVCKQRHSVTPCWFCCRFLSLPVFTVEPWPGPFLLRPAGGAVFLSHVQQEDVGCQAPL